VRFYRAIHGVTYAYGVAFFGSSLLVKQIRIESDYLQAAASGSFLNSFISVIPISATTGWPSGTFSPVATGYFHNVAIQLVNAPPAVSCRNVTVSADETCTADASIDNGSFDPDEEDTITLIQSPAGPYPLGETLVTLTVIDSQGESSSCQATVTVLDGTHPSIACPRTSPQPPVRPPVRRCSSPCRQPRTRAQQLMSLVGRRQVRSSLLARPS
jgi:hypothetical protein